MNHAKRILITLAALALASGTAAAAEEELANEFSYCAAVASTAKLSARNLAGQKRYGSLYTRYLWASIAASSPERAKALFPAAIERHEQLFREGKTQDELTEVLADTLKSCDERYQASRKRIDAYVLPQVSDMDMQAAVQLRMSTPIDLMSVKGKPVNDEYIDDGRFIYNFPSARGFDLYHFDHEEKLERIQSYCDIEKAKCGK